MDRTIVYPGSIPLDADLLNTNRNTMVALGALIQATLGTGTLYDGLTVIPDTPASLKVWVSPGSITQLGPVDQNSYGSLAADTADGLMKMGVNLAAMPFTLAAPGGSGQSIAYLIQASLLEADADPVVLPYYNAANPAVPYLGPGNTGVAQPTLREQRVQLQLKAGAAATTGSQIVPAVDAGWIGLAEIDVAYGQTVINSPGITQIKLAALAHKLPDLRPGFSNLQIVTASDWFVVPAGAGRAKVTVIGAGGAGGTHATLPAGGGGAGGRAIRIIDGLTPGSAVFVTIGAGGVAPASPGDGGDGGTSSFGIYVSATGGSGGDGGTVATTSAGAAGGGGVGGDVNLAGAWGTDAITAAGRGGDGGGPANGRGTTGSIQGIGAAGYGGGGGGGGSTAGGGVGAQGGDGGQGLVIVEY